MIVHVENPKESTSLLELISNFSNVAGQAHYTKSTAFLCTSNELQIKTKNSIVYNSNQIYEIAINLTKMWNTCTLKTTKHC